MSERKYDAAIFDLDDTILKTAEIKWLHHKHVAKTHWGIELSDATLAEHWGKPFNELVGHLYENSDTVENMIAANRQHEADFPKAIQVDTHKTLDLLDDAGVIMGIVTAINSDFALNDLQVVGIAPERFLFVQGAEQTDYHKPDPRVFIPALDILKEKDIDKKHSVYVGDALSDFYAARDADLDFVGVSTGFVKLEEFEAVGAVAVNSLYTAGRLITAQ